MINPFLDETEATVNLVATNATSTSLLLPLNADLCQNSSDQGIFGRCL